MPTVLQKKPDQKRVSISSKRQFTIPQKYYTELGFRNEAICTLGDGILIIQPVESIPSGDFSEQILSELINEGYSGQELLIEFKKRQAGVRPAVEKMLEAAKQVALGNGEYSTYNDVFNSED